MAKTVICYVKTKTGKQKKYRCKDSVNFIGPNGKTYNAPNIEKHEILEIEGFMGKKQMAFYKEDHENPIPLNKEVKWRETTNHDSDIAMLVRVTRDALLEVGAADLKQNIALGVNGVLILILLVHHFW